MAAFLDSLKYDRPCQAIMTYNILGLGMQTLEDGAPELEQALFLFRMAG